MLRRRSRDGVIRVATLEASGIDSATVYRRCLPGGPWRRLLPGVVLLQDAPPSRWQRLVAALLYAGPDAQVTGVEACRAHGLELGRWAEREDVHLLTPHEHKVISSGFVTIERTHRLPRALVRRGIPTAPVARAALDAARRHRSPDTVAKLLIEAVQKGGATVQALRWELDRGTPRGTAVPRRVLKQIDGLRSVAELHGRRVAARLTVAPTHWNPTVRTSSGDYLAQPDAWWDDVALAWEIDSVEFHYARADYARTLARNSRYAQSGIAVVQTLPSRLLDDADAVIRELDAAYRAAAARPRPPVRIVHGP